MRLVTLTRLANENGFKVTRAMVRYHLMVMEKAGLVKIEGFGRTKWARRVADVRLQVREFLGPSLPSEKEIEEEIRRALA